MMFSGRYSEKNMHLIGVLIVLSTIWNFGECLDFGLRKRHDQLRETLFQNPLAAAVRDELGVQKKPLPEVPQNETDKKAEDEPKDSQKAPTESLTEALLKRRPTDRTPTIFRSNAENKNDSLPEVSINPAEGEKENSKKIQTSTPTVTKVKREAPGVDEKKDAEKKDALGVAGEKDAAPGVAEKKDAPGNKEKKHNSRVKGRRNTSGVEEKKDAPGVEEKNDAAPGVAEDKNAPVVAEKKDAPGVKDKKHTRGIKGRRNSPVPVEEKDAAGVVEKKDSPVVTEEKDAPGANDKKHGQGVKGRRNTPGVAEKKDAPGIAEKKDAPGVAEEKDAPGVAEKKDTPVVVEENSGTKKRISKIPRHVHRARQDRHTFNPDSILYSASDVVHSPPQPSPVDREKLLPITALEMHGKKVTPLHVSQNLPPGVPTKHHTHRMAKDIEAIDIESRKLFDRPDTIPAARPKGEK